MASARPKPFLAVYLLQFCVSEDAVDSVIAVTNCSENHTANCRFLLRTYCNFPAFSFGQFRSIDAAYPRSSGLRPPRHTTKFFEVLHRKNLLNKVVADFRTTVYGVT